jgi:hypothetical protein
VSALLIYQATKLWRQQIVARLGSGSALLATDATDGFLHVPSCEGVPTGTPEEQTGLSPLVVDRTNNRLYFYSSGAWRNAGP